MMKTPFSIALLCLLTGYQALGQQIGQTQPDAKMQPGIAPTGQGLDNLYSPNLFDGSTTISIPIYPYEAGGINCGVGLSYNTKGIRVDQVAGSCGLNWNLNAAGSVVRVVKDLPDEINIGAGDSVDLFTNPFSTGSLTLPNTYTRFRGRYVTYAENSTDSANTKIYRDKEADEFIVNAGKLSFSFYMGKNGTFFTNPEYNARIEVLIDDNPVSNITGQDIGRYQFSGVLGFKITDIEGNQYYFSRGDYEKKRIMDEYQGSEPIAVYYAAGKWDVKKIVLAAGGVIDYTYKSAGAAMILPVYVQNSLYEGAYVPGYQSAEAKTEVTPDFSYFSEILSIVYPDNTRADFIYDPVRRCDYPAGALNQVKISGGTNCLRYVLDQSYFLALGASDSAIHAYGDCYTSSLPSADPNFSTRYQRLKLDAIRIMSCDSSISEAYYSFGYDPGRLPPRMDGRQDYFGYYNGAGTAGTGNIPAHNKWATGTAFSGRNKTPDPSYIRASLLTRISNGYGGSVTFYHGGHKAPGGGSALSNKVNLLPADGYFLGTTADDGLRVDSTVEADIYHPGNTKVTRYTYEGGQRFLTGGYFHYPDIMKDGTDSVTQIVMGGACVTPHQMVNGGNHGYSQVTVSNETQSGQLLSKKVIRYTNFSDNTSGNQPRYYTTGSGKDYFTFPYTDKQYIRSWEMGLPLSISDYDANNRIILQTLNYYTFSTPELSVIENTKTAKVKRKDQYYDGMTGMYLQKRDVTDSYSPYRGTALLDSVITRNYVSDTRWVPDTVRYVYNSRHHLKATLHRNSEGYLDKVVNVYNYDIRGGSGPVAAMNSSGLEKVLSVQRWHAGSTTAADKLIEVSASGLDYQGTMRPKNTYVLDEGVPLTFSQYTPDASDPYRNIDTVFSGGNVRYLKKAMEITLYDSKGNPLETQVMSGNSYKAMIWDTTTGQKLAEAANCRYNDIAYTSFETNGQGHANFTYNPLTAVFAADGISGVRCFRLNDLLGGNTSLQGSRDLQVNKEYILSFWSKGPGPAVSIGTTPLPLPAAAKAVNGWSNYIIRFTPAVAAKVKISGTGSGALLDEVRLHPAAAVMQSNTYTPLFGITSVTSASGRITYTEYDKMGRAVVVRDQDGHILSRTQYIMQGSQ